MAIRRGKRPGVIEIVKTNAISHKQQRKQTSGTVRHTTMMCESWKHKLMFVFACTICAHRLRLRQGNQLWISLNNVFSRNYSLFFCERPFAFARFSGEQICCGCVFFWPKHSFLFVLFAESKGKELRCTCILSLGEYFSWKCWRYSAFIYFSYG